MNPVRQYISTTQKLLQNHSVLGVAFTGKERDEETGYGYFGARYMDFMNYVEGQGGLKTGTFSIKSWAAEKIFKKAPEQGSHSLGNL